MEGWQAKGQCWGQHTGVGTMAGTGQVSMLQMSPSLPELLAQTLR